MDNENNNEIDFINFDDDDEGIEEEEAVMMDVGERPYVQIQTSTGASQIVLLDTIEGEPTIDNVVRSSGLAVYGVVEFFVDGNEVTGEATMADGQVLTIIGNVKGA